MLAMKYFSARTPDGGVWSMRGAFFGLLWFRDALWLQGEFRSSAKLFWICAPFYKKGTNAKLVLL